MAMEDDWSLEFYFEALRKVRTSKMDELAANDLFMIDARPGRKKDK